MLKDKDSKQSIQVTIRVRPLSEKQKIEDPRVCVYLEQSHSLKVGNGGQAKKFTFDSICFEQSQQQIFERVGRRCTLDCLEGYNCTVFAYGQTGAGKTYTMMGLNSQHQNYQTHKGLIPRTMKYLFECIQKERSQGVNFIVRCSFLEIYNQQIIDLLNKSNTNLQLRQDTRKGVYVQGITQETVSRSEEVMDILNKGSKSRHVGSTFYNQASSRSHSVFTMLIQSRYSKNGVINTKSRQFNFIDLAGSQRTKQSTGQRLKQGCNINKSLMNLASVINALSEVSQGKSQHVNYRNSKLTFLLKDSLGGNSKTNLIANISPAAIFYQQTLSTLGFARRAKLIKRQKASINEDSSGNLESMKNEIKRLKQQVITLMGRLQSGEKVQSVNCSEPRPEMTSIMHQYVAEQIDKQTRLQMQILKLNQRITHLQNGLKQYSANDTHLRMIISVLEDKISRLKSIESALSVRASEMPENQNQIKVVKEYFQNERQGLIKQLESFKGQSQGTRVIKELLKQARIVREDTDEQETLKQLLSKNTQYLTMIHNRLEEMRPEKQQIEFNDELEKRVNLVQVEYVKREQEQQQRIQQLNLQLNEAHNRHEQSQKLLEQAISDHILLQQKIKIIEVQKQQANKQLKVQEQKMRILEQKSVKKQKNYEETIIQLKNEISTKIMEQVLLKKQIQSLKIKIQKLNANETILKNQFETLEQQKYKIDKLLLQNIQQIKEQKNLILKSQIQFNMMQQSLQVLTKQKIQVNNLYQKLTEQLHAEKKKYKAKLQEIQSTHIKQIQNLAQSKQQIQKQLAVAEQKIKDIKHQLSIQNEELQILGKKYSQMQNGLRNQLILKQNKMKDVITTLSKKQENGNQIQFKLTQTKAQLINLTNQKEQLQSRYKKEIDQMKDMLSKSHTSLLLVQQQLSQELKIKLKLNDELTIKKKQLQGLAQENSKYLVINSDLEASLKELENQLGLQEKEVEQLRQTEKKLKGQVDKVRNELFAVQKNQQIEVQALRSQLALKEQHSQSIQKQHAKNKIKLEKQIAQLNRQLNKNKQTYEQHQNSLKKSVQVQLISKEKRVNELKSAVSSLQENIKQIQSNLSQIILKKDSLEAQNTNSLSIINQLNDKIYELTFKLNQSKCLNEQLIEKHQKEIQQAQMIHNEQLDQKNQKIESLMIQIDTLGKEMTNLREVKSKEQEKLLQFRQITARLQAQLSTQNNTYQDLTNSYKDLKETQQIDSKQLQQIKATFANLLSQKTALQQRESSLQLQVQEQQKRQIYLNQQLQQANIQLNSKQSQLKSLRTILNTVKLEAEEMKQHIAEAIKDSTHFTQQVQNLKQINEQLKLTSSESLSQLNQKYDEIIAEKEVYARNNQTITKKIAQLQSQRVLFMENSQLQKVKNKQLERSYSQNIKWLSEMQVRNNELLYQIRGLQNEILQQNSSINCLNQQIISLKNKNQQQQAQKSQLAQRSKQLSEELTKYEDENQSLCSELKYVQNIKDQINVLFEQMKEKSKKDNQRANNHISNLKEQIKDLLKQHGLLNSTIKEKQREIEAFKDTVQNYQNQLSQIQIKLSQVSFLKQQNQGLKSEIQLLKKTLQGQQHSKQRLYAQVCRERENNSNFKLIIENSQAQIRQLQHQLQQKDAIYKKLLEKIAKNQNQSKKTTNSEHYLKTIQLLQKSRAQQLQLRRQNQDLKKALTSMKQTLQEKQNYVREVEKKSEGYCVSMHKRLEEIQKDYCQLQRNQEKLIKQKKSLQKIGLENETLKQELKKKEAAFNKLTLRQQDLQNRFKQCNLDYISLEKDFQQLKKSQVLVNNHDQKTNYINRLKAQVAALKTEKVLLTDSLNKERQEKTKLKSEIRFGKDDNSLGVKLQLQKKANQNKNLQELIFEIVSHLKICVNQPKTKLEAIRSVILGTIKQKFTEIKALKERMKQLEEGMQQSTKLVRQPALRQFKALSVSNTRNQGGSSEETFKFQKEKDPTIMDNLSRQKMRQFQNHYARLKQNDQFSKYKNV